MKWTVKSEKIHSSVAAWDGPRDRDGGKSLIIEAVDWVRANRQPGRMIIDFGAGGSMAAMRYEQKEHVEPPPVITMVDAPENTNP
jgi:hypothetical protein